MNKDILPKGGEGPVAVWGASLAYCIVSGAVDWWPFFTQDIPVSEIAQSLTVVALGAVIAGIVRQFFKMREHGK